MKDLFAPRRMVGMTDGNNTKERRVALILLALTVLNSSFQIGWFWRFRAHNITMDAVNYIGLARHLLDGDFTASLHGYWSPLFSWVIAAGSPLTRDFTLLGRLITIASFLICLPLLYWLTFRLWQSHLTAAFAVLWFSLARGVIAGALATIQADFLLTALTLMYFVRLLACLRQGTRMNWFLLGIVHATAFLAKAIAMPWLAITTALAVLASPRKSLRSTTASLLLAFLAPAILWVTWGELLKTKYGVFTTGYQLRANLMTDLTRKLGHRPQGDPNAFVDTPSDKYLIGERPWASLQEFNMMNPALVPVIFENELRNLPAALKEIVILLTPGGVLGLIVGIVLLTRYRDSYQPEAAFAWISMVSVAALIGAYGMLVFDARYVLPITPILIALASHSVVPGGGGERQALRPATILQRVSLGLLLLSTLFFALYWASPFRTVDRDFQASCYHAAALLKESQPAGGSLVSIGDGPYPEHGIGFEVGVYVAYLSGRRLVAMNNALPGADQASQLAAAVLGRKADAVLIWGQPSSSAYHGIVGELGNSPGAVANQAIQDPRMGEVGRVVFFSRR